MLIFARGVCVDGCWTELLATVAIASTQSINHSSKSKRSNKPQDSGAWKMLDWVALFRTGVASASAWVIFAPPIRHDNVYCAVV
jgi:hypothetical protein